MSDNNTPVEVGLSAEEMERYARHIALRDVGLKGQKKLKQASVLVVGAGGLGAPVLQYLAACGIGQLSIVDDDVVSLSNLQRQIIHDSGRIGEAKVDSAKKSIGRINPHVQVKTYQQRLDADNGAQLINAHDVVIDGSDNFETRKCVAALCEQLKKPLVAGAVGQFDGSLTTFMPFERNRDGNPNPRFEDLFPVPPDPSTMATCEEVGVMGVLTGMVGTMQAQEAVNIILGIGEPLVGRLLLINSRAMKFDTIQYARNSN